MKQSIRKCAICDKKNQKTVNLEKDKFIYDRGKYYHYECYVNKLKEEGLSEEKILLEVQKKIKSTQNSKVVQRSIDKDRFYYWIYDNYNISTVDRIFFNRIELITQGRYTFKINEAISYYDLLQIFKKMKSYLDKQYYKKERKGESMTAQQRTVYDLAIVINNYDEYKKWKQKQSVKQQNDKNIKKELKEKQDIDVNTIVKTQQYNANNQDDGNNINISDLLDEMF